VARIIREVSYPTTSSNYYWLMLCLSYVVGRRILWLYGVQTLKFYGLFVMFLSLVYSVVGFQFLCNRKDYVLLIFACFGISHHVLISYYTSCFKDEYCYVSREIKLAKLINAWIPPNCTGVSFIWLFKKKPSILRWNLDSSS
jgi:hypothetical protein